jgi:hypothetical protein
MHMMSHDLTAPPTKIPRCSSQRFLRIRFDGVIGSRSPSPHLLRVGIPHQLAHVQPTQDFIANLRCHFGGLCQEASDTYHAGFKFAD